MKTRLLAVGSGMIVLAAALLPAGCGGGCDQWLFSHTEIDGVGPDTKFRALERHFYSNFEFSPTLVYGDDSNWRRSRNPNVLRSRKTEDIAAIEEWRVTQIGNIQPLLDYSLNVASRCSVNSNDATEQDTAIAADHWIDRWRNEIERVNRVYTEYIAAVESRSQ